jgi:hypothetical protein
MIGSEGIELFEKDTRDVEDAPNQFDNVSDMVITEPSGTWAGASLIVADLPADATVNALVTTANCAGVQPNGDTGVVELTICHCTEANARPRAPVEAVASMDRPSHEPNEVDVTNATCGTTVDTNGWICVNSRPYLNQNTIADDNNAQLHNNHKSQMINQTHCAGLARFGKLVPANNGDAANTFDGTEPSTYSNIVL